MRDTYDITIIDTGYVRPGLCAAYLVVENGRAALIDCGTASCAQRVLDAIDAAGVAREAVDWLLVTHVHLDHAGAAGPLIQALPNARLVVHPRGAPHMIDPTRLIAGAKAVYGEVAFARDHGGMLPVPEERVVVADDGHVVDLAGRALLCVDTPGHARHHYSVWDARSRSWFAGDTFGLSYREFDNGNGAFILPTTSPVQFDPQQLHDSIDRLLAQSPASIHVAHYGEVGECERLAADLHAQIDAMVAIARAAQGHDDRHARIVDGLAALYTWRAREHGIDDAAVRVREILDGDIELNAQGLGIWLDRDAK
ncbi:MBL fold metallo-hydrolase [Luteimonas sp. BDR2-5]|uniref:MBL fold metallo-hydrolase n=1 Tax=Proluteimonas luteida TaxID=2878685 RepID=UPI001E3EBB20|nr:MBL fold metallo-hydrolase [Luteimonas sp. BDR2-5]MCD9029307.1 MBL fold metallo-hydrolase [Luteimonas sp. BDR2-5]